MFQYACARALSEKFGDSEIVVNPHFNSYYTVFDKIFIKGGSEYFVYQLNLFELNPNVTEVSPVDDIRLMYNCKHFVISKSMFSWWGSYMSQNPVKIVIVPNLELENDPLLTDENMDDSSKII